MRLGTRLNDVQNCGMPLTSVAGGLRKLGSLLARPGFCGPGSVSAFGLVTLTAPSGGRSGLPKPPAARAAAVSAANPPAASIVRRERFALIISLVISTRVSKGCFWGFCMVGLLSANGSESAAPAVGKLEACHFLTNFTLDLKPQRCSNRSLPAYRG